MVRGVRFAVALVVSAVVWVLAGELLAPALGLVGILAGALPGAAAGLLTLRGFSGYRRAIEHREARRLGSADLDELLRLRHACERDWTPAAATRLARIERLIIQARENRLDEKEHPDTMLDSIEARLSDEASAETQQRRELAP